jgi:protein-S-isoprenylcysteine O-methyltransferase Ste14
MVMRRFLTRHRIVRNAIRNDLLFFFLPWILVFTAGLIVSDVFSAGDGWVRMPETMWRLIRTPRSITTLSAHNMVGIALFVLGLTISIVAHITIGRNYSSTLVIREDHQLITHGIYKLTRHPIYLGTIMACIGFPVYASSLYGFLIMSAMIPIFLVRIKIEERLLTEEFGKSYRTYMEDTSKLIPFIY